MDFSLTEEQSILKDTLGRLLGDHCSFEARRTHLDSAQGWSQSMWARYAGLGLMALPFPEATGGDGGSSVETMIVMEALGEKLALEPYLTTVVLGGGFVRLGGDSRQREELIPAISEGLLKIAFAHTERHSRYDLSHVETSAQRDGDGYVLSGAKGIVIHGDSADKIFVTARTSSNPRSREGIGLFLVDVNAEGVSRRSYRLHDGLGAADLTLDKVKVPASAVFGDPGSAMPIIQHVVDIGIAALAAESVGVMSAMQALTLDYLKTRQQFGMPIGSFQALQHKAVDMYVAIEQARSMALYAAMMAEEADEKERARAMHAVKAEIGRSGRLVGETAIQLHGGVGMTMEFAIGHYFKRMTMIDVMFGDSDHHLRSLGKLGGLLDVA